MNGIKTHLNSIDGSLLLVLSLLLLVSSLLINSLINIKEFKGDEIYYKDYVQYIHVRGVGGFPSLVQTYLGNKEYWYSPHPLRIGFIGVSALCVDLFGLSFHTIQLISVFSHIFMIFISYVFARKYFGSIRAMFIAALLSFSPICMAMSRRALGDSLATCCMAVTIWLFLDLIHHSGIMKKILFIVVFCFAILVKETSILFYIPFLAFLLIETYYKKATVNLPSLLVVLSMPVFVCGLVYLLVSGGFYPLFKVIRIILVSPYTNRYAVDFGSGPWYRYLIDFILLSPWPTLLAIGFVAIIMVRFKDGVYDSNQVYFVTIFIFLLLEFSFFTKNIRYLAILDLPIRVFAVFMLFELISHMNPVMATTLCFVLVFIFCLFDYQTFNMMVVHDTYDPVSALLLMMRNIIPPG